MNHPNQYLNLKIRGLTRKYDCIMSRGGKCEICGYDKNIAALEFHHKDPNQKELKLDARTWASGKLEDIQSELEKCSLLCANCHRELHYPDLETNYIPDYIKDLTEQKTLQYKEYKAKCLYCGKPFPKVTGKKYCSKECRNLDKNS